MSKDSEPRLSLYLSPQACTRHGWRNPIRKWSRFWFWKSERAEQAAAGWNRGSCSFSLLEHLLQCFLNLKASRISACCTFLFHFSVIYNCRRRSCSGLRGNALDFLMRICLCYCWSAFQSESVDCHSIKIRPVYSFITLLTFLSPFTPF